MPVPETPPQLLPGRPALEYSSLILRSIAIGIAMTLVMGFGFFVLPEPVRSVVTTAALFGGLGAAAGMGWAGILGWHTARRERRAGYTTMYGSYLDAWQLDPKTGEVLRRPGEREAKKRP